MHIETLHTVDTEYAADTVEWCPFVGWRDFFACGTYQLEERDADAPPDAAAKRIGRLYLFRYDRQLDELHRADAHDMPAILDLKWTVAVGSDVPLLAAANALGEVRLFRLAGGRLEPAGCMPLSDDRIGLLTLAIDWSPPRTTTTYDGGAEVTGPSGRQLVASDSRGRLTLAQLSEGGDALRVLSAWPAHGFEAWTCAFDRSAPTVVYTGGDDMALHVFDTRTADGRVMTNRSHGAGVTALHSFGDAPHLLATGSYDEQLRVFDTRWLRAPVAEVALGGGIWRIKPNPARGSSLLLCANMYHNFSVVRMAEGGAELTVCAEYFEHKSICYGADWMADGGEEHVMATCSFYDHKLCVAKVVGAADAEVGQ